MKLQIDFQHDLCYVSSLKEWETPTRQLLVAAFWEQAEMRKEVSPSSYNCVSSATWGHLLLLLSLLFAFDHVEFLREIKRSGKSLPKSDPA